MEEVIYVELCLRTNLNERWLYGDINSEKADEHYRNHVVNNKDDYDYFIRHNDPRFLITAPTGYSKEQAEEYCKKEYLRRAESLADSDAVNYDSAKRFNKPVIGFKSEEKSDDRYIKIKSYLSQNGLSTAQELVVYCRDKVTGEPLIISYMLCNRNKAESFITRAHSDLPEEEQHVNNRYGEVEFVNQFNEDEVKQFPSFNEAKRFFDSNPNCFSCKEIKWGKPVEGRELHRDKRKATASALNMSVISNIVELSDNRFSEGDARDFIKLFGVDLIKSLETDKLQQYISEYIELYSDDSLSPEDIKSLVLNESHHIKITEALLTEANRQQLLQKSRKGKSYAPSNQYNGRNRFERRTKSSISATVRDYNMIQMDPLFKRDILEFKIPVMGETDVYVVDVRVDGLLAEIRKQLMANKGTLEFKVVLQSLMKVLNIGDVYIGCNCPDARYRQAYWQTSNDYKAGYKERRPSNITNPHDDLGAGCKHVLLILANLDWAVKVASVINNYIKYCKEHLQRNYADYIFPKIYGMKYDKAVQLNLFDNGLFPEDQKTMKAVIDQGFRGKDEKGKFAKGNEYRFQKKEPEPEEPEEENPLDLKFRNEEEPEEETPEEES